MITNFDLFVKWIVPIVGFELVLLILWQSLDPLVPMQRDSPFAEDEVLLYCGSASPVFLILNLVYYVRTSSPLSKIY